MKVYIASRLENADAVRRLRDVLRLDRHTITYDWTRHGSVKDEGPVRIAQVAVDEIAGVLSADIVIVLLPGGRGTHVELGAALGAGKSVVLAGLPGVLDGIAPCFYRHPLVSHVLHDSEELRTRTILALLSIVSAVAA